MRPRSCQGRPGGDAGVASIWVLALGTLVLVVVCAAATVGSAISARHRAESSADLVGLAAAGAARVGDNACAAGFLVAAANHARLTGCRVDTDGTVQVTVTVALPPGLSRWVTGGVGATARAGVAVPSG